MTNEQKANAIADFLSIDVETLHKKSCYLGTIEMAKWKEKQIFDALKQLGYDEAVIDVEQLISSDNIEE